jgi:hypothetical protein
VFAYNKTALDFSPYTNTRVLYNTFKYNETGVLMQVNYTNVVFNNNCFENNTNRDVELKYSSKTVHFTENYWGTTDSASIHARITDFYSNFNLPKAFFMPVLQQADSSCQIVSPTAIVKVKDDIQQVICYPNPAIETIVFRFPHLKASKICLYDLNGRTLIRHDARGKNEMSVNVSGLTPGLYIYQVASTNGEKYTGKFQKN